MNNVLLRRFAVPFGEGLFVTRGIDERLPLLTFARRRVQHELKVHFDEPGDVFRPLDIAAHPVNRVGNAAEHNQAPVVRASAGSIETKSNTVMNEGFAEHTMSILYTVRVAVPRAGIGRNSSFSGTGESAITQVSLLPPPCDEFTTREPFL